MMKNRKGFIAISCSIAAVVIGYIIWWNVPCSIISIEPAEVSKIEVFDGNTGKSVTITDVNDIEHIIENLSAVTLRKDKISLGYMGYSFRTTIYKVGGDVYKKFIINSKDTIRKDPFFYRDSSESIDYKYIREIVDKYAKWT